MVREILKKIFKFLIVVAILFMVYVLVSFFYSKSLIEDIAKAIYEDDIEKIYELTGDKFVGKDYSIYNLLENEYATLFLCKKGVESFSYSIKNAKPTLKGFVYEIDVTTTGHEVLLSSGENLKEFFENDINKLTIDYLRNIATVASNSEEALKYNELHRDALMREFTQNIYLDDIELKDSGVKQTYSLNLLYNFYTRRIENLDSLYNERRGLTMVLTILNKSQSLYNDLNQEKISFYSQDGTKCILKFCEDIFIGIDSYDSDDFSSNEKWYEINRQFIEQEKSKQEIVNYLKAEGYVFTDERLRFVGIEDNIEVVFSSDEVISIVPESEVTDFVKTLSKDEMISALEEYGYYLGEEVFVKKDSDTYRLCFYNEELLWFNIVPYSWSDEIAKEVVEHVERNNLNKKEILEYLAKEGFERIIK